MSDISALPQLPLPLIQLIHLHLLEYPLANNPEYDQSLFDPTVRGLRDRTKSMEDACFFLVGKVEGRREAAKPILPTYPCSSPAETTAFRTSLAKYLETLRHTALYPKINSSSSQSQVRAKGKAAETVAEDDIVQAWWWKDVVVRKSLLEECAGERFERMLLAFSTHALLKYISSNPSASGSSPITFDNAANLIQAQRRAYVSTLAAYQDRRNSWELSASLLSQKADSLQTLRDRLSEDSHAAPSVYGALATDKLLGLASSKEHDLVLSQWSDADKQRALDTLIQLAGFAKSTPDPNPSLPSDAAHIAPAPKLPNGTSIQPLPIAAAHHPASLKALRAPVFAPKKSARASASGGAHKKSYAGITLSAEVKAGENLQVALGDALGRARRAGEEMLAQLGVLRADGLERATHRPLDLWDPSQGRLLELDLHKHPSPELAASVGLGDRLASTPTTVQSRVAQIRESLLPQYPPVPVPAEAAAAPPELRLGFSQNFEVAPRPPSPSPAAVDSAGDEPGTPRRLATSTPPFSVKPRSAHGPRFLGTHTHYRAPLSGGGGGGGGGSARKGKIEFLVASSGGLRKPRGSTRKSMRTSLAFSKSRPSMFGPGVSDGDHSDGGFEDDVGQIVQSVQDESTSFEAYATPKGVRLLSPHKSQSRGSPFRSAQQQQQSPFAFNSASGTPRPRASFKIVERLSLASLPSPGDAMRSGEYGEYGEGLMETQYGDALGQDGEWTDEEYEDEDEDGDDGGDDLDMTGVHEGHSVALRDILLQAADMTQFDFDLLGTDEEGPGLESLAEASFAWE